MSGFRCSATRKGKINFNVHFLHLRQEVSKKVGVFLGGVRSNEKRYVMILADMILQQCFLRPWIRKCDASINAVEILML